MGIYVEASEPFHELLNRESGSTLLRVARASTDPRAIGEYLHWDKVRHLSPPDGLTPEEWWLQIKLSRAGALRPLPLVDAAGRPLTYSAPDQVLRSLHRIDQRASGSIAMGEVVTDDHAAQQRYLVNSLMEEAIRSSQLEGATTSRKVAKDLLVTGRTPRDRSERMIMNNYRAMLYMREDVGAEITPEIVLNLHRILTEGTLDNPDAVGRLQRPDEERIAVLDRTDASVLHQPPPAEQLPDRLAALCAFANDAEPDGPFIHPVVRAIILHFWIGYDHPFEDGNGRTARALFYWYMRTRGYWLTEYLSISRILRNAPGQYSRAYLYSEKDEGDVTYFLIYQLEVIERAIEELHVYLRRKVREVKSLEQRLRGAERLNARQRAVVSDAMRHPERQYTIAGHASFHRVTHETARTDLMGLAELGLLDRHRRRRPFMFSAPDDLSERLENMR
jgi:Fic family protein